MYVRKEPVYITSRTLKVFTEPASAGTGLFLDSDQYEEFEVGDDVPAAADFGIRVSGDSMEPVYVNKQIVWVHQQDQLENGDICSLRPLAVANAFFNGRYAEQNGRSYLVDC